MPLWRLALAIQTPDFAHRRELALALASCISNLESERLKRSSFEDEDDDELASASHAAALVDRRKEHDWSTAAVGTAGAAKVDCMLCGVGYGWTLTGVIEGLVEAGFAPALEGRALSVDEQSPWTAVLRSWQWCSGHRRLYASGSLLRGVGWCFAHHYNRTWCKMVSLPVFNRMHTDSLGL